MKIITDSKKNDKKYETQLNDRDQLQSNSANCDKETFMRTQSNKLHFMRQPYSTISSRPSFQTGQQSPSNDDVNIQKNNTVRKIMLESFQKSFYDTIDSRQEQRSYNPDNDPNYQTFSNKFNSDHSLIPNQM